MLKPRLLHSQAFFAQIYSEAQSSRAAPGHVAIAELHKLGRLQRHYTLNIDGLAGVRQGSDETLLRAEAALSAAVVANVNRVGHPCLGTSAGVLRLVCSRACRGTMAVQDISLGKCVGCLYRCVPICAGCGHGHLAPRAQPRGHYCGDARQH